VIRVAFFQGEPRIIGRKPFGQARHPTRCRPRRRARLSS
jgi:hypothetical protein